jgi:hypothetical protein
VQLKNKKIAGLLSAATCSLLGTAVQAADQWDVDSAVLLYSETDRVTAIEPVISAKKDLGDDETITGKLVLDNLTGSSANGAVPSTLPQTFTGPSGEGTYTAAANETPLDETFRDTRASLSLNWDKPVNRNNRRNLGINLSMEHDFTSFGGNALWSHEMNQKNTTLTGGISLELDSIKPVGATPVALSDIDLRQRGSSSESREVVDALFGVTQIIDKSSLFQVNYSISVGSGYMTDPYKILSVVDASTGEPDHYLYENRPDSRTRQSVYGKYKKQLDNKDIVTASYRFMTDDWGVNSHTIDFTYRYKMDSGFFIQPHLRFYQQTEADFYRYFLVNGDPTPEFASADYRLGELTTTTVGVKFGKTIDDKHVWSVRLEMYQQSGNSSPSEAFGQLTNQDLFPDVNSVIAQVNYSFKF